jgi:alcohol dehydrogenase (cytochrome c)
LPLSDLTAANVARLQQVCTFDTGEQVSFQTGPVVNGVMCLTSDRATFVIDAATGTTAWDIELGPILPGVSVPMAPVAWNGTVFVGNAGGDNYGVTGHVWALDEKDGQ